MHGNNTVSLNQASIMQMVQEWFDRNLTAPNQKVESVAWNSTSGTFDIRVSETKLPSA